MAMLIKALEKEVGAYLEKKRSWSWLSDGSCVWFETASPGVVLRSVLTSNGDGAVGADDVPSHDVLLLLRCTSSRKASASNAGN